MNYLDAIARRIAREVDPDAEPDAEAMGLWRIYAVLALAKGGDTTWRDVHDAWAAHTADAFPEHRSLVPFDELSPGVQALDAPYCDAIRRVAWQLAAEGRPCRR